MLKKRLIPILLLKNGRCVKGVQFKNLIDTGNPVTAARVYDAQNIDELIFLDISASSENRNILFNIVSSVAEECFMPLTVGGGIKNIEDIYNLFRTGADKVSLNSFAVLKPKLISQAAKEFGSANIVVAIDAKIVNGKYKVFIRGGQENTGIEVLDWIKKAVDLSAGEILLTSIDREGTRQGYDLGLIKRAVEAVSVPVIVNGGAGTLSHLAEGIKIGEASAVAAASIFHFTDQSPIKAKTYLLGAGINIRATH